MFTAGIAHSEQRLGYCLDDWIQFPARAVTGVFFLATASRPDLEPTQPPIQSVPGNVSHVLIFQGVKLTANL